MALRYRCAGVFTLTTLTIILNEELCSAETFQSEQNRIHQCPPFSGQVAYSVTGHTDILFQYVKLMTIRTAGWGSRNGVAVRGFMSGRDYH